MSQLDDLIRGRIAAYGNARGWVVKNNPSGQQVGNGNIGGARNRGKPGYPDQFIQLAPDANDQPDEGFQVQSEPMGMEESRWLNSLVAAGALAASSPVGEYQPQARMGDLAALGGKEVDSTDRWLRVASYDTGVQEPFLRAIMDIESRTRGQKSISSKGAVGHMQLMPATAEMMDVDPHDAGQNILGGARYIAYLAQKYNGNPELVVMGYNMGPTATDRAIRKAKKTRKPLKGYVETQKYFKKMDSLMPDWRKIRVSFNPNVASAMRSNIRGEKKDQKTAMREGHGAGVSHFNTDLSGKQERTPGLDDNERKNRLPDDPVPLGGLSEVIGGIIFRSLREDRATRVAVTGGRFQPFHRGHAAIIRKLASAAPKVIIFTEPGGIFSPETMAALVKASLPDIWDKIEMYPGRGSLEDSAKGLAGQSGTTMNTTSNVSFHPMPDDDEISAKRIRDALQDDEKDMVRRMLDPRVSAELATFEQIYSQMRRELDAGGKDTVEVVTDAPVSGPQPEGIAERIKESLLAELGMGAMETGAGFSRGGAFGHSAWSGYNPRGNFEDDDEDSDGTPSPPKMAAPGAGSEQYQNMTRSPSTRMTDLTYSGVPNDHMPGDFGQHLDDDDNDELNDPTDLSEIIVATLKKLK